MNNLGLNQDVSTEVKKMLDNLDKVIVKVDLFASIIEAKV